MQYKLSNVNEPRVRGYGISLFLECAAFVGELGQQSMQIRATGVTQVLVVEVANEMTKITRWTRTQNGLGPGSWLLDAKGTATNAELFEVIVNPVLGDTSVNELH